MKRRELLKGLTLIPLGSAGIPGSVARAMAGNEGRIVDGPLKPGPDIYRSIGVEPVINCRGTLTIIGGSTELPEVRTAMEAAAQQYVQLDELAMGVGKRLSELTGAEWGMVSAGCAAGLKLVTAACVTDGNPEKLIRIPDLTGFQKTEVIIPRLSRTFYDHAVRNIGVKIIMVDTPEELAAAISDRTAMIYMKAESAAPLAVEDVARIAKPRGVPVIVDAAAFSLTIPEIHLQKGATVVAYSGGKALRGPQCAGMLLGNKELLLSAWQASSPHHGPGRDNKIGREEHIGMLAAVEAWVKKDQAADDKLRIGWLNYIAGKVAGIESVATSLREPSGLNNRGASLTVSWDPRKLNITGEEVSADFFANKPRIALGSGRRRIASIPGATPGGGGGRSALDALAAAQAEGAAADEAEGVTSISISSSMMQPGNEKVVAQRLYDILTRKKVAAGTTGERDAPADIQGSWDVTVRYTSGTDEHKFFIEKQESGVVKGTHKSTLSTQDISGTVRGNRINLASYYGVPGDHIQFNFSGEFSGDTITGTLNMGEYLEAKFTAKRHKYPAAFDMIKNG